MLKKIIKNRWIIISFIVIYIGIFLICSCNMFAQDEYNYSNIAWTNNRLESFSDIITSQISIYKNWSGRIPVLGMVQVFLYIGKGIYDLINPLVFLLFIFLILKISNNKVTVKGIFTVLLFAVFGTYKFWEKYIWISGSLNYLWTVVFMLIVVYYLYNIIINDKKIDTLNTVILFITSFISGWSHENTAFVLGSFIIFLVLFNLKKFLNLERNIRIKLVISIILFGIGAMILIFCPGNFGRLSVTDKNISIWPVLKNIAALYKIILLYIVTIIILKRSKTINSLYDVNDILKKQTRYFIFPIIIALLPMIIISEFPVRAALAYEVMLYIIILQNLQVIYKSLANEEKKVFNILTYIVVILAIFILYYKAIFAFCYMKPYSQKIENQIKEAKVQGKENIVISEFEYKNIAELVGVYMDVFPKNTDISIINTYMSNYYNVNNITAVRDGYAQIEIVLNTEEEIVNYDVVNKETNEVVSNRIKKVELPMPGANLKGRILFEILVNEIDKVYVKLSDEIREKVVDIKIKTNSDISEYDVNSILM